MGSHVFSPQTSHKCPCSHPLHICDSSHTYSTVNELSMFMALGCQALIHTGKKTGGPLRQKGCFLRLFMHWSRETAYPYLAKVFLKLSSDMAMLLAHFRFTYPPPPVLLSKGHWQKWHCEAECLMPLQMYGKLLTQAHHHCQISLLYLINADIKPQTTYTSSCLIY